MSFDQQTIIKQIIKPQEKKIDSQIRNIDNKTKKYKKKDEDLICVKKL